MVEVDFLVVLLLQEDLIILVDLVVEVMADFILRVVVVIPLLQLQLKDLLVVLVRQVDLEVMQAVAVAELLRQEVMELDQMVVKDKVVMVELVQQQKLMQVQQLLQVVVVVALDVMHLPAVQELVEQVVVVEVELELDR